MCATREEVINLQKIDLCFMQDLDINKISKLAKLGLYTVYDLIFNIPFRYEDRTYVRSLDVNQEYEETPPCNFLLTISAAPKIKSKLTEYKVIDHLGNEGALVFFHVPNFLLKKLNPGIRLLVYGSVKLNSYTKIPTLSHPNFEFIEDEKIELPLQVSPIYHLTAGIKQSTMRKIEASALELLCRYPFAEYLPAHLNPYNIDLNEAFLLTHNPTPRTDHGAMYLEALPSYQRICYEELIAYKLTILELKAKQNSQQAPTIEYHEQLHQDFLKTLPFTPTSAQDRVFHEIIEDCKKTMPMNRLVHGDVGSGKTLVAAMVMLQVQANNMQSALLAPTDLLAKQHHRKLSALFAPLNIEVALVTGTLRKKDRNEIFAKIAQGTIQIIVGTHALFQKDITYQHLALVIVDEQHRFGVAQREALLKKAPLQSSAHELLMTATPIPRSMQFALFSDTDVSTIDVMPQGRTPIVTTLISQDRYLEVVNRLQIHCGTKGNQAYWVCPLVEESEISDASSVKARFNDLHKQLPHISIGLLHAQMNEKAKNETMEQFVNGKIKILVATTIVEVGVDVPNATVMVIESAEKLGLAQLHQLRGRVGRGDKESFCLLMYKAQNKNDQFNEIGIKRLEIMRSSNNGFEIANQDLEMRGAGEFFGTNQAGKENFRFSDLNRDYDLIKQAQKAAQDIYTNNKEISYKLIKRWFPDAYQNLIAPQNSQEQICEDRFNLEKFAQVQKQNLVNNINLLDQILPKDEEKESKMGKAKVTNHQPTTLKQRSGNEDPINSKQNNLELKESTQVITKDTKQELNQPKPIEESNNAQIKITKDIDDSKIESKEQLTPDISSETETEENQTTKRKCGRPRKTQEADSKLKQETKEIQPSKTKEKQKEESQVRNSKKDTLAQSTELDLNNQEATEKEDKNAYEEPIHPNKTKRRGRPPKSKNNDK